MAGVASEKPPRDGTEPNSAESVRLLAGATLADYGSVEIKTTTTEPHLPVSLLVNLTIVQLSTWAMIVLGVMSLGFGGVMMGDLMDE